MARETTTRTLSRLQILINTAAAVARGGWLALIVRRRSQLRLKFPSRVARGGAEGEKGTSGTSGPLSRETDFTEVPLSPCLIYVRWHPRATDCYLRARSFADRLGRMCTRMCIGAISIWATRTRGSYTVLVNVHDTSWKSHLVEVEEMFIRQVNWKSLFSELDARLSQKVGKLWKQSDIWTTLRQAMI